MEKHDSIFDEAMTSLQGMIEEVSNNIASEFKNTRPFDKKEVARKKLVGAYSRLTQEQRRAFIAKYGQGAVDFFDGLERG